MFGAANASRLRLDACLHWFRDFLRGDVQLLVLNLHQIRTCKSTKKLDGGRLSLGPLCAGKADWHCQQLQGKWAPPASCVGPLYRLVAVLVHQGVTAQSGHYYAYVSVPDRADGMRFQDMGPACTCIILF